MWEDERPNFEAVISAIEKDLSSVVLLLPAVVMSEVLTIEREVALKPTSLPVLNPEAALLNEYASLPLCLDLQHYPYPPDWDVQFLTTVSITKVLYDCASKRCSLSNKMCVLYTMKRCSLLTY